MFGLIMAFQDFIPGKGFLQSQFVGFENFAEYFQSPNFFRTVKNTFLLGAYATIWSFPIPIIFALLLNELKDGPFKRIIQSVSYLPRFVSVVVIVGIMMNMLRYGDGVVNMMLQSLGMEQINFFNEQSWFRTLFIASDIWQGFGWNSIIYIAAITGINYSLYEAADMDGASRLNKMFHITLPSISGTIIILLILTLGNVMSVGFEKIILMYNPSIYDVADVISTYTYRKSFFGGSDYGLSSAIGMFNSFVNFILLIVFNSMSKKLTSTSLY